MLLNFNCFWEMGARRHEITWLLTIGKNFVHSMKNVVVPVIQQLNIPRPVVGHNYCYVYHCALKVALQQKAVHFQ